MEMDDAFLSHHAKRTNGERWDRETRQTPS